MTDHALEIERLNRLYVALTQINKAIVQNRTRDGLFQSICKVLVADGGFGMAWVGWHDPETHRLAPVAQAGDASGYLQSVEIYADDRVEGSGPSGTAFRENRPYVCNDLVADPTTLPWRGALERAGFRASAVIPIQANGAVSGTLTVYADRPGFFRDREIALLAEAGADVSAALDVLDVEAARTRAEAAVEREQRFARGLIEAMPGIFYLYDEQGRFLRWNRGFERLSGYTSDEIAQMHPLDFFPADERAVLQSRIAQVFEKGEASVEAAFVSKDGSATPYFFTGKRIVFDGAPHLVGVGLDISERRRAEDALRRSEERYRTTLDTILEGGQLLGFDWRYLYLNPAAAIQNRRPNSELLGRRMPDAWPGIEATDVFALLRRCMTERVSVRGEIEFPFADGAAGWFDVRAQPVPEGIFVLSIDISEHKRAEKALRDLNESLERKVAERTVDLAAARERAEAADRVKSSFLATMSHELRTPLNSILGFTGIVLNGMAGALNPEQSKQLGVVQSSARHLLDLINDVLDISKIEAGQLEVRRLAFDLRTSVERVTASVMPLVAKRGLVLRWSVPDALPPMVSDARRVEQILINLLSNAIKFTERGEVTLTVEMSDGSARFRVTDTGIGMKQEDLSTLFQPFRQIDSGLQRQHEGTGLGLAICRRLTELLGGTI
ncbi:MAG TPA: PAS domain S-box protein, partial [Labilithrix sp.]|nr:PAS domain S-box protein [Labilithrix sp.]